MRCIECPYTAPLPNGLYRCIPEVRDAEQAERTRQPWLAYLAVDATGYEGSHMCHREAMSTDPERPGTLGPMSDGGWSPVGFQCRCVAVPATGKHADITYGDDIPDTFDRLRQRISEINDAPFLPVQKTAIVRSVSHYMDSLGITTRTIRVTNFGQLEICVPTDTADDRIDALAEYVNDRRPAGVGLRIDKCIPVAPPSADRFHEAMRRDVQRPLQAGSRVRHLHTASIGTIRARLIDLGFGERWRVLWDDGDITAPADEEIERIS